MNNHSKSNPWNKNPSQPKKKKETDQNAIKANKSAASSENKFEEAQKKLQAAVEKHVKDFESSSEDEEELESENLINSVLKNYTLEGGSGIAVGKTRTYLNENLLSGAHTCLICISRVKREDQIWSCIKCSSFFHLLCIQRWSKDSIVQQKQSLEHIQVTQKKIQWGCPKCRFTFNPEETPTKYLCFCGKSENPKFNPFLVPHSCGEICKKDLIPKCGHKCLLLCHPGACPPCPVTVSVSCYCGSQPAQPQRCSSKEWSCGQSCNKVLSCHKHKCSEPCHPGDCKPCPKKSVQKCFCKTHQELRDCAEPNWHCDKVCRKPLSCGNHKCKEICHEGDCPPCPRSLPRTCPCGKTKFKLPCTKETPTCLDTCNKLLECGQHTCNQRCHKDNCGPCLEIVEKSCRCGQHIKKIQCCKFYLCETKCKHFRDCYKHPCNRKCCDRNCPPCEKLCNRTLRCGNHKCSSVCHRGPCYPCNLTDTVTCRCGQTKLQVPCGKKHKTKPPKCIKPCSLPPDCHHKERGFHYCHFGSCPPCKKVCKKTRENCPHLCPALCHSSVLVKVEAQKASMPWEHTGLQVVKKELPCPDCIVPVPVTCLGGHETADLPCYMATPSSCQRPCGRLLLCGNHFCSLPCHPVESPPDNVMAGLNCEVCESGCVKPRPIGCRHTCLEPCHPGPCPPCKQMVRIKCHCGLTKPYIRCNDWLDLEKREELQSCGNQCPKNFECGHRCRANCHPGPCPDSELCKRKVKITCLCKRIKKEFHCDAVRNNTALVECDAVCEQRKEDEKKMKEAIVEKQKKEEEMKNKKELEKYQKMFEGKKKYREKKKYQDNEEISSKKKYKLVLIYILSILLSIVIYFILL